MVNQAWQWTWTLSNSFNVEPTFLYFGKSLSIFNSTLAVGDHGNGTAEAFYYFSSNNLFCTIIRSKKRKGLHLLY